MSVEKGFLPQGRVNLPSPQTLSRRVNSRSHRITEAMASMRAKTVSPSSRMASNSPRSEFMSMIQSETVGPNENVTIPMTATSKITPTRAKGETQSHGPEAAKGNQSYSWHTYKVTASESGHARPASQHRPHPDEQYLVQDPHARAGPARPAGPKVDADPTAKGPTKAHKPPNPCPVGFCLLRPSRQ